MDGKTGIGRPPLPESERAGAQIQLRVQRRRKSAYVRAASKRKQTLAAWCFEALDKESGYVGANAGTQRPGASEAPIANQSAPPGSLK